MATADEKKELIAKLTRHVKGRFGGTGANAWQRAFAAYDADRDGAIKPVELGALLKDAGVGNFLTLPLWIDGVLGELDKDHTGTISLTELSLALGKAAPTSPVFAQAREAVARPDYLFPLNYTPNAAPRAAAPKSAAKAPARPAAKPRPPAPPEGSNVGLWLAGAAVAGFFLLRKG